MANRSNSNSYTDGKAPAFIASLEASLEILDVEELRSMLLRCPKFCARFEEGFSKFCDVVADIENPAATQEGREFYVSCPSALILSAADSALLVEMSKTANGEESYTNLRRLIKMSTHCGVELVTAVANV